MAVNNLLTRNPERWFALENAVEQGWSLNEITRTLGICHKTVRKWYPDYRPFPRGGGGEALTIRQVNRDFKRLDDHGNMRKRRHNN